VIVAVKARLATPALSRTRNKGGYVLQNGNNHLRLTKAYRKRSKGTIFSRDPLGNLNCVPDPSGTVLRVYCPLQHLLRHKL
jgi:hypothetical protein